jgi:SAM-dependent methyltransferase
MPTPNPMSLLYRALEHPWVYALNQFINPWTVDAYAGFVRGKVRPDSDSRVLDIGCGLGAHYSMLTPCRYTGIDINAAYVAHAARRYGDVFQVMDAGALTFAPGSFDAAVSVATCHHLSDQTIRAMIKSVLGVLKPGGLFHIIDPVLPLDPNQRFKRWLFENDRGRFQRRLEAMRALLASEAPIADEALHCGPAHDVSYFALRRDER